MFLQSRGQCSYSPRKVLSGRDTEVILCCVIQGIAKACQQQTLQRNLTVNREVTLSKSLCIPLISMGHFQCSRLIILQAQISRILLQILHNFSSDIGFQALHHFINKSKKNHTLRLHTVGLMFKAEIYSHCIISQAEAWI